MKQLPVAWAETNARFSAMFEALVIGWLKETSISGVAELLALSWDEVAGIQERAVTGGLPAGKISHLSISGLTRPRFRSATSM